MGRQATSQQIAKPKSPPQAGKLPPLPHHPKVETLCSPPMENISASTGLGTQTATLETPVSASMDAAYVDNLAMEPVPANPKPDPRTVVTPLSPECAEEVLCKYGLYYDWKHWSSRGF